MSGRKESAKWCNKCRKFFFGETKFITTCLDCGTILRVIKDFGKSVLKECVKCGKYWSIMEVGLLSASAGVVAEG